MCMHTYIAIIENLQGSPNVNEPPTLPEVTTGSTVGEEDGTSINEGNYICMHTCIHAYTLHTSWSYSISKNVCSCHGGFQIAWCAWIVMGDLVICISCL